MMKTFTMLLIVVASAGNAEAFQALAGVRLPSARISTCRKGATMQVASSAVSVEGIKSKILQVAALTDRGQRLNTLAAPTYQVYFP